jgi:PAS domain S-box-containing protein
LRGRSERAAIRAPAGAAGRPDRRTRAVPRIADQAPIVLWTTDATGACTYLNGAWYAYTGQSEAEAWGWAGSTPSTRGQAEAERVFLAAKPPAKPFRTEYRLRRADGVYRWAIDLAGRASPPTARSSASSAR